MPDKGHITTNQANEGIKYDGGWEITVTRSLNQIDAIRPLWEQMQQNENFPNPNPDINRYLSVIDSADHEVKPYIMISYHNSQPQAMLIGRIGKVLIPYKFGYRVLLKPFLRCISVVFEGIIGNLNPDVSASLVRGLVNSLRQGEADVVFFNHLRADSPVWPAIKRHASFLCREHFSKEEPHYRMSIPTSMEQFYQSCSKSHRSNLKRYIRRLDQKDEGRVKIVAYSQEEELGPLIRAAAQISSKTYQYGLGCGFVDDKRTRSIMTMAARLKWLRAHVMYIGDQPCSFQLGLKYGPTYFLSQIGFDPSWEKFEVGTVLFLKVLESLCSDPAVRSLDFGFGDAQYKKQYANEHWMEVSSHIFAPRLYPICVNISRSFVMGLNLALEHVLIKTGFLFRIKKRWRSLLQQNTQQASNQSRR
jgi:CelD/BcsL family acetyltransferase involved in cellulose biosynthesis